MDVYESRRAFNRSLPEKNNNNVGPISTRRPATRELRSNYKSPTPSSPTVPRRFPSPNFVRTIPANSQPVVPKRAISTERKRPSTPASPSTPVRESSVQFSSSVRKAAASGGRLPEALWPSTMRSLSVSFQSDTISIPVSKKEKPAPVVVSDRTLRPSSNVAHKQPESPKANGERKRSPLKGKNAPDQLENSKPVVDRARLIDQHRWPSRVGGKVSSNSGTGLTSSQRKIPSTDSDVPEKPLPIISPIDYKVLRVTIPHKVISTDRLNLTTPVTTARSQFSPTRPSSPFGRPSPTGSRPSSPFGRATSTSRPVTPTRPRPSTPTKGSSSPSPARIRPSSPSANSTSVLSFIADVKKGQKTASYIEDAHQLRLLHNRYLQWHFANARAESMLHIQKINAERNLYDVWNTTLNLRDSVLRKRINVKQLKLELKLNTVLNNQVAYLDEWSLLETDHMNSLSGCLEDLEASTIRLPVTGGAKADIDSLKLAICSAVDVMQAMGPSICSLLSRKSAKLKIRIAFTKVSTSTRFTHMLNYGSCVARENSDLRFQNYFCCLLVEAMNSLVYNLAVLAGQEKTMIDECESLLASTTALQTKASGSSTIRVSGYEKKAKEWLVL
ncbi:hypothetical protein ACFE04_008178 [Oxalis oulophora]